MVQQDDFNILFSVFLNPITSGIKINPIHTSIYADTITIEKIIKKTCSSTIILVNMEISKWFDKYKPSVNIVDEL